MRIQKRQHAPYMYIYLFFFFFQAEDGIRDAQESRGLGDVYKRQRLCFAKNALAEPNRFEVIAMNRQNIIQLGHRTVIFAVHIILNLSLIHI